MSTVQDILDRKGSKVVVVAPEDTVLEAARRMSEAKIGAVVVLPQEKGPAGIFSERDLMQRVVTEGLSPAETLVSEVMTSPVAFCRPTTTLEECRSVMTQKRLRHLPVFKDNELAGIISSGDLIAQELAEQQDTIEYLHEYLHGRM